ncbi:phage portal protein [Chitinophaga sp. CF418]|uniref:phage portal protein n=1 Tax=Chitinophaga sp. CF418 TaxID=1855287 RepID=UPI000920F76D|nr:phage portal protein [Chitinophaga sp. CF418]SHN42256.1 phage portal protein, lambda family [Chitinophaga sp. CF418]
MNLLEKAIAVVSPSLALRRVSNRAKLQVMDSHVRRYEGGAYGPRFSSFGSARIESTNKMIARDRRNLVARSQHLSNNSPYARRAPKLIANNVVGTGIVPTFTSGSKGSKRNVEKVVSAWEQWAKKLRCDYDGNFNFYGLQKLAMQNVVVDGEIIAIRKRVTSKENKFGIQVLMLGGEYIDTTKHTYAGGAYQSGGYDYYGIKYDEKNKRVGYWIYDRNPLDGNTKSTLIPIEDIAHVYEVERPQQNRGVPFSASTLLTQKDGDDYADAELLGKKAAACMPVFVTNADPEQVADGEDDRIEHLEPGTINYLRPNEQVTIAQPPQNPGYSDYMRSINRAVATGYGVTYEQLTGDLSNVNFSSGRMGKLEFHRNVDDWQYMLLIPKLCEPVLGWFLEACEIAIGVGVTDNIVISWTTPRREMIDPVKETNSLKEQNRAGYKSWQEVVRSQGDNPDVVFNQLVEDQKRFEAAGLSPDWTPAFQQKVMQQNGKSRSGSRPGEWEA